MTNSKPLFTIITVCYNSESTLADTFNSVLSQSLRNFEYLVIDGQSTDSTLKVIKDFQPKFSQKGIQYHYISEADSGIYDAMNKGLKLATGDVIGILNSDDLYANNSILNEVMTQFNNDLNLDILYGDLVYVKHDNINKIVRTWTSKPYYPNFFENGGVPPHPSLFVSARVYQEAGYFNLKYRLAADYEFM